MVDYGAPFKSLSRTRDPRVVRKILIGASLLLGSLLLSIVLIGILGFLILSGYLLRVAYAAQTEEAPALPDWDQYGSDLGRGFQIGVLGLIWSLPSLLLTVFSIIAGIGAGGWQELAAAALEGTASLPAITAALVASLWYAWVMPGVTIAFIQREFFQDGLRIRTILAWTWQNRGQVAIIAAANFLVSVPSIVNDDPLRINAWTLVTIGAWPLMAYYSMHIYGQLARHSDISALRS